MVFVFVGVFFVVVSGGKEIRWRQPGGGSRRQASSCFTTPPTLT